MRNKHIPHIEDVLFSGEYEEILEMIDDIQDPECVTLKVDGSPSIIAGHDPNGDFFVSTKSALNKTPILFRSEEEIWENVRDPHLADKLLTAWFGLEKRKKLFRHVFQGDFLERNFDGIYQSNLVKYEIDMTADSIIVWHTQYEWVDGVLSMVEPTNLSNILSANSYVESIPIQWIPVEYDLEELSLYLTNLKPNLERYERRLMVLSENKNVQRAIARTISTMVNEHDITTFSRFKTMVKRNLEHYFMKDVDSVVLDITKMQHFARYLDDYSLVQLEQPLLEMLYNIFVSLIIMKSRVVWGTKSSFFKTDGIHEGLVVTGKNGKQYKIVDRLEFSAKNNQLNRGKS